MAVRKGLGFGLQLSSPCLLLYPAEPHMLLQADGSWKEDLLIMDERYLAVKVKGVAMLLSVCLQPCPACPRLQPADPS